MIGRVVGTSYRIVEKIGEGGMGAVYRAVDQMLERDVALKAIRPELAREPDIVERFRAEAKALARIHHPAIANVYSFFYEGEDLFLAMEFVRGRPLSRVLASDGPIPRERAIALLGSAMAGIQVAHDAGIVHRDLKPENLMVTGASDAGTIKVMDFGIARVMGSGHLTRTGLLVGTLRYMSPEQIRGEEVDGRADVYALGAVLYEMLTGRPPFEGASDWAILRAQIEDPPRPPSEKIPQLPWWIDRAVLKALDKTPAERFQTVEEMHRTLIRQGETMPGRTAPARNQLMEELPTVVTPPGSRTPTPPPVPAATVPLPPSSPAVTPPPALPPPLPPAAFSGPSPSSYRPVEISPRGTSAGKVLAVAALLAVLLGIGGAAFWLTREKPAEVAQTGTEPAANPAVSAPPEAVPATGTTESRQEQAPAPAVTRPAPAPVPPPSRQTALPPEPQEETTTAAPESQTSPGEPAATDTPPGEEPTPTAGSPMEEMRQLASDLQTRSAQLIDTYQAFLDKKDEADQEITDDDEQLQEDIEALADVADRFHKQVEGGGFFGRIRRRPPAEHIIKVQQRGRELVQQGQRVDDLMNKVQPGPEVRQAWQDVRRKWKRVAEIAAGLR